MEAKAVEVKDRVEMQSAAVLREGSRIWMKGWCIGLLVLSLCALAAVTGLGSEDLSPDLVKQRGWISQGDPARLLAVFAKAERGEPITVAAIGGSITAGGKQTKDPESRYIRRLAGWFSATFPRSKVTFINAGIGSSNSYYGSMRVKGDVIARHPDLVVVDFAVNNKEGLGYSESYEGILRQLLRETNKIAVVELFFMHRHGENEQALQEVLGRHYRLPMISFRDAWWPEICTGRAVWETIYADDIHPNDYGHRLVSELLNGLLENIRKTVSAGAPLPAVDTALPPPMLSSLYDDCSLSQYQGLNAATNSGWARSADGKYWEGSVGGSSIEFEFTGRVLFMGYDIDKGFEPLVKFAIDHGASAPLKPDANRPPIATGLAAGRHRVRVDLASQKSGGMPEGRVRIWAVGTAGCLP